MKHRMGLNRPRWMRAALVNGTLLLLIAVLLIWGIRMRGENQAGQAIENATGAPVIQAEKPVTVRVYDHETETVVTMDLEEYVCHVVAAEMPASYEPEALKAQAVAARTLAAEALAGGSRGCTDGADLCTSSEHCQAFDSEAACRKKWGENYAYWWGRITEAVYATKGLIITYEGEPIEVFYHAVSGGRTEDVENVFSQPLPYLRGVDSEGEESESHYEQEIAFDGQQFIEKVERYFEDVALSASGLSTQVRILGYYESGRVKEVRLGDRTVKAVDLRRALGLPSTQFTIRYSGSRILFDCIGYGHGVGMSQAGANVMARSGSDYLEILTHYYTGVVIEPMETGAR